MKKTAMLGAALGCAAALPAFAQTAPAPAAAAPAAPASTALTTPALTGPLAANPNPGKFEADPFGTVYVTGEVSGLAMVQGNAVPGDKEGRLDVGNLQLQFQKTEGLFQFYVQGGLYSLPSLGTPYLVASQVNKQFFGPVPVVYGKLAPTDAFSIQGGKLPTLFCAEYTFTVQNMNIERGLLWNQEPAISKGVQANYTLGPLAFAVSFNDGYYSDRYNWIDGSATWTIDPANTLSAVAGGNIDRTKFLPNATFSTPLAQSNSQIFNLIYTYNAAPWTVTPYFQYTNVPKNLSVGITGDAQTYGGAILANYAINENWNLAGRAEIIGSSGSTNLLFGPGSSAWSLTVTPTWQNGIFFARAEASIVGLDSITKGAGGVPGTGFGKGGNSTSQGRFLFETGVLF